jgi:amino acid adenylation domain-containing protein
LEYNIDLFDDVTISRLSKHFTYMLARIEGGIRLSDLPLLSEMELHEVVTCFNDSQLDIPMDAVVHDLFKATARRVPDAVAVSAEGRTLRYRELDEQSDRLARRLVRLGVGPDVLVGICAERTPALLVALLAVLKAGGAYVPLDPTNPPERLRHILADSGALLLLTETALLGALPPHSARILLLDGLEAAAPEGDVPLPRVLPDHLAYVIYTSGSTGRPKGVEVRHRGVVNFLLSILWRPGLHERDVMLGLTTLSFDIAVTELFLPLVVGARIELVRRETGLDAAKLAAVLESAGVTYVQATPATWTLLVDSGWPGRRGLKAMCGGEALPRALARKLLPRVDTLWNYYGPTETTVWSSFHQVDPSDRPVPLGYPLGNTALHLLGRRCELVPAGAVGELAIGGEGLARGYRGRPDLTAERFVPDPLGPPGARLYRTGDLARRRPDGLIEYLGRLDHQVKIRGFRIEIGEIEAVLLQHPAVRQCAVVALGGGTDKRLVAYVVQNGETAWEELRAHLQEKLPSYMVPASVVFLDRFPLLASGKVDRKSLPDPGRDRPLSASYVSPQSENERLIAQIWQEVLGLERVGIHDNFFDLGGHSLLAAEVHGKLRERLQTDLPLVELFRHPTVHALAQTLSRPGRPEPQGEDLAGLQDAARREREASQRRRKALAARQRGMG